MAGSDTIVLRGTVSNSTNSIEGVMAKIRFPAIPTGRPRMLLRPESRQIADSIVHWYKGRFEARRPKAVDGSGEERVCADLVYFLGSSTRMWSHDVSESIIRCDPVGLLRTIRTDAEAQSDQTRLTFHLTPNPHLVAASISETSFDGSCIVQRVRQASVQLLPEVGLVFDQHYRWNSPKGGPTTRSGYQVATSCVPYDAHDPIIVAERILPALDDFLVLTSLASSQRVVCVGWQASGQNARWTQYYRGGMSRPSARSSHALDMGLIPLHAFQQFITDAWPRFRASPYYESLKALSYAVVPGRRSTLEREFIGLFTALEDIVLCFRRQNDLVNVLPPNRWTLVQERIKAAIRGIDLSKEERRGLYDNLSGLNRVALYRAYSRFIESLRVDLTDLWPVFSDEGNGLLNIRNRMVHGDLDATLRIGALVVATDHLRWTLERIALSLLGWPVQVSEVRPNLLASHATSMGRLADAMKEMRSVQ